MARFQFMSGNRDLSLNIAQGLIDIAEKNGKQADSQDVCNMIDELIISTRDYRYIALHILECY